MWLMNLYCTMLFSAINNNNTSYQYLFVNIGETYYIPSRILRLSYKWGTNHYEVMDTKFLNGLSVELNSKRYYSRCSCRIGFTDEIRGFVNSLAKTEVLQARRPDELNRLKPRWQKTCSQIHHKLSPRRGKLQCKHGIRSRLGLSFFTPPSQKKTANLARTDRKSVWNERSDHKNGRETSTPRRGSAKSGHETANRTGRESIWAVVRGEWGDTCTRDQGRKTEGGGWKARDSSL